MLGIAKCHLIQSWRNTYRQIDSWLQELSSSPPDLLVEPDAEAKVTKELASSFET